MSSTLRPSPEQIDAIKLQQIISDIDQKRAAYLRKEQERRFEPLKLMLQAMAAAATLVGAGVALGAFLVSRMH
jgi:hypothetical protein